MRIEENLTYGMGGGRELKLDLITPDENTTRTAVLFLHGGGWRGGSKDNMHPDAKSLAKHGFVAIPTEYRLTGESPWPAHIEDVKAAIRWTRANAERLGIDPDKIAIEGSSAGAHLALLAAATPGDPRFEGQGGNPGVSTKVAAVVAVHPPVRFHRGEDGAWGTAATGLMGAAATEEAVRAASPYDYVTADFPPTLLLHGAIDTMVKASDSQKMYDALKTARAIADLHIYHGHHHGFASLPSMRRQVQSEAAYFLERTVVDPAKYAAEIAELSMFARRAAAAAAAPA